MKKHIFLIVFLFIAITSFFFYPIFKGNIPFPGDLLVGNYAPYNSYSYLGYAPGGVPHKAQGPDVIRESFPWKSFVIDTLKKGQIPFWNPYNFSGNSLMANLQSAVFYPFNVIFFMFSFPIAWSIFIFIAPLLAAFFTYLFLRELRLSTPSSIFGGIVYAFSSYMVVWMEYGNITHTYLWLPLALLFTEKLTKRFTRRSFFLLILTLFLAILAGYIQGFFYMALFVVLYFSAKLWPERRVRKKRFVLLFLALLFPVLLTLFQILSTARIFKYSTRGNYTLSQIQQLLNPWWYAITVVIPDFFGNPAARNHWFTGTYIERVSYIGLIPFIFALSALFSFRKRKEIAIFGIVFIGTFFLTLDLFVTKYIFTIPIPTISTTVPTRILGLFQFCGSILAAFGLEVFLQKRNKKNIIIALVTVLSLIFVSWILIFSPPQFFADNKWTTHREVTKRNLILPTGFTFIFLILFLLQFYEKKFFTRGINTIRYLAIFTLFLITILDLFYFFHKITPFSPKEFIYPKTDVVEYLKQHAGIYRFWGYGAAYITSNFQTYDKTFSPEGDDPLHIKPYTELLETSGNGKVPDVLSRPDANIAPGYGEKDLDSNYYRQKVLNVVGVKYILNKDESLGKEYRPITSTFNDKKYKLIWQKSPWQVYENLHVVPRAFLTNNYIVIEDKNKFFQKFFDKNFNESSTIILNEDPKLDPTPLKTSIVKFLDYQPNSVTLETNADSNALLFLSDNYYFSWRAFLDGNETKIYLADYTFRAVPVPKGKHTVRFYYNADFFKIGLILSIFSAVILGIFLIKIKDENV